MTGDFSALKNTVVPNLLKGVANGINKAQAIEKCCPYRDYLLEKLEFIQKLFNKVQDKLGSSTGIYLYEENWSSSTGAEAETWWSWGKRNIRFNLNSSYSYFSISDSRRRSVLFHELTHVHGTEHNPKEWWNNAHTLDDGAEYGWEGLRSIIRNEVILKKGENASCPTPRWPDNP